MEFLNLYLMHLYVLFHQVLKKDGNFGDQHLDVKAIFSNDFLISIYIFLVSTATLLLVLSLSVFIVLFFSLIFCLYYFFHKCYQQKDSELNCLQYPLFSSSGRIPYYDSPQISPFGSFNSDYPYLLFGRKSNPFVKNIPSESIPSVTNSTKRKYSWRKQRQLLLGKPCEELN